VAGSDIAHEANTRRDHVAMAQWDATDLAHEEELDAHDPLRHLRNDDERDIVPSQPPSVHNQSLDLTFPTAHSLDAEDVNAILIRLVVDASPGCGGIAWPAGEVGDCNVSSPASPTPVMLAIRCCQAI
jgi:hypothetical protein